MKPNVMNWRIYASWRLTPMGQHVKMGAIAPSVMNAPKGIVKFPAVFLLLREIVQGKTMNAILGNVTRFKMVA